jgi:hypothetical protein
VEAKRPVREAHYPPPASAEVKKMCVYTSLSPYVFMAGTALSDLLPYRTRNIIIYTDQTNSVWRVKSSRLQRDEHEAR